MKIMITGINGQVGSALVRQATVQGHDVVALCRKQWDMARSPEMGRELVLLTKPDLVINAAAYTNVDGAEDDEITASKVNADAPRALAKGCKQLDIPIFHISTDYVFDGAKEEPYVETDQTNPINVYGRTKLLGELAINEEARKYIILRTSWVFSEDGNNFVNTIMRLAKERDGLKVVDDQIGGPTNAECMAKVLLRMATEHEEQWGIYHFSGQPFVSWYEFAEVVVSSLKRKTAAKKNFRLTPCSSGDFNSKAKRPKSTKLSNFKIESLIYGSKCDWEKFFL